VNDTTRILLYALVAGLSPLALLATLAALGSGRGRLNGLAFAVGLLLTQTTVLVLAIALGSAATPDRDLGHPTLAAVLEMTLGVLLLLYATRGRSRDEPRADPEASRTKALLDRLSHLRPVTAFSAGALLGVGGVKRLTITLFAGATIAISGLVPAEQTGLAALYIVIASVLVWLPVAVYLVAGKRADAWTERTETWIVANEQRITSLSMVAFGLLLIGHALILLL
jgi:threonine/homoserine/homoserine lactone efflux protein